MNWGRGGLGKKRRKKIRERGVGVRVEGMKEGRREKGGKWKGKKSICTSSRIKVNVKVK